MDTDTRSEHARRQALHDERRRRDPSHDQGGCVCCCLDCALTDDEQEAR